MGLRWTFLPLLLHALLWQGSLSAEIRIRREAPIGGENKQVLTDSAAKIVSSPSEAKIYHPPLLAAPPAPRVSGQSGYQPPLLSPQHNEYKPLISSSQTQSVRYQPPNNLQPQQGLPLAYSYSQSSGQPPQGYTAPLIASPPSGNANALPAHQGSREGLAFAGDHSGLNQFSQHPPGQAQGAETKPSGVAVSSNKDGKNDEYVVYYYYYYDNDTNANGSSNFDDIPSLESYDSNKANKKEHEKIGAARALPADVNSLSVNGQDSKKAQESTLSSQPRSASSGNSNQAQLIRSDKIAPLQEETAVQPLKPVSNVFRYGSNEVPRFPILPNFIVSEAPPVTRPGIPLATDHISVEDPTTQPSVSVSPQSLHGSVNADDDDHDDEEADDENNVVDQFSSSKTDDDKEVVEEETTTTTTEPPTTTEAPTTTTEKARRRPGAPSSRRRFNPSPGFTSTRRQGPTRASTTTTTTTTTTPSPGAASTRGSFRGSSRARPRPSFGGNRPRASLSRTAPSSNDNDEVTKSSEVSTSSTSSTTSTTARPRFSAAPSSSRRFSSTRTRSQPSSRTTRSTTTTTTSAPRARPSVRPRPNLVTRNRPRPGFLRPKAGSEPEEPETTTVTAETATEEENSSPSSVNESSLPEDNETSEESDEEETSDAETEEPTTTEKSRFSALFRPRNRSTLNRPRPPIGNRSRRSR